MMDLSQQFQEVTQRSSKHITPLRRWKGRLVNMLADGWLNAGMEAGVYIDLQRR